MSSKIEIRKLAELACGTSQDSPEHKRFIAAMNPTLLLDLTAPVVERQQPEPVGVLMLGEVFNGTQGLELDDWDVDWYRKPIDELNAANPGAQLKLYVEPPELAELQATIAKQAAEIERLKGGQREPVAYLRNEGTPNNLVMSGFGQPGAFKVFREFNQ
jgi:hypothetical protein